MKKIDFTDDDVCFKILSRLGISRCPECQSIQLVLCPPRNNTCKIQCSMCDKVLGNLSVDSLQRVI